MRLLYLTHRLPFAPNRGDRIRAYHILRTLASRMDVHVLSLVHDREEQSHVDRMSELASSVTVVRVPKLRNLARAVFKLPTDEPLTHVLLDSPELPHAVRRVAAAVQPDVVMPYCSGMARLAMAAPLNAIPCVLDMVDVDSHKWSALSERIAAPWRWIYAREGRLLAAFESAAVEHAAATLVVNAREKRLLDRETAANRVVVIQNGVDLGGFRPPEAPVAEPRVVFCGVMDYQPNEEGALWLAGAVWPLVRAARPDAILSIVGSRPTRRVRQLGTRDDTVRVTGAVPDVRPYLWGSAVAAAPLATAHGVQNKVLEAIAAGLPCVVTPAVFDGLPEEARAACSVADVPDAFAADILRLLSMTGEDRRAIACRTTLDALDWASTLSRLPDLLEKAVAQRDGSVPGG